MPVVSDKSVGQIAYEAYRVACPVSTFTGDPLPLWEDIDPELIPYWEAVGQAVAQHVTGSMQALVSSVSDGEGSAAMRQAIAFERLATVGERLVDGPVAQLLDEVLTALREELRLHGS